MNKYKQLFNTLVSDKDTLLEEENKKSPKQKPEAELTQDTEREKDIEILEEMLSHNIELSHEELLDQEKYFKDNFSGLEQILKSINPENTVDTNQENYIHSEAVLVNIIKNYYSLYLSLWEIKTTGYEILKNDDIKTELKEKAEKYIEDAFTIEKDSSYNKNIETSFKKLNQTIKLIIEQLNEKKKEYQKIVETITDKSEKKEMIKSVLILDQKI